MRLLITGGAGFIGSNFIHHILRKYPGYEVVNLDKLTYAGNLDNLRDIENDPRYRFVKSDICDEKIVDELAEECDAIINFAAESHVDRSITDPKSFVVTDILGAHTLLEAVRKHKIPRYIQIGTDESYGSIDQGSFKETDPLTPSSPYSASKAGADLLCSAYSKTYGTPVLITRSSNNFGPYQYPEKLVSLFVTNALEDRKLPLYGDGQNVRDWIYVEDNCEAIDLIFHQAKEGEIYNVGGGNEVKNIDIARKILQVLGKSEDLIEFVTDRPGHDRRYSLDSKKTMSLGWQPHHSFDEALKATVKWYQENEWWWRPLKASG